MTRLRLPHQLHGLRAQVLLWTVLPLTIFLIVFALSGVSSHQRSMRALAIDPDDFRLVTEGRHEIFDRALRPPSCDPEAVVRALKARGADFLLITGGGYADAHACLAGQSEFRVDFDDPSASLVLFKLVRSGPPR